MNDCLEIEEVSTIKPSLADHVFLCSASPEKRCCGVIEKLSGSYRVNQSIIIQYEHKSQRRKENMLDMEKHLLQFGSVDKCVMNESAVLPKINELILNIRSMVKKQEPPRITIDITTIIKWHLLLLLKALAQHTLLPYVRFLYTEPQEYVIERPLSVYVREIFPVPLFQGHYNFSRNTLLVIILGYEGNRAIALFENIDPDECLLIVAKPAYNLEWEGRTEKMNKEIINLVGRKKVKYLHSRNPRIVTEQLEKLLLSKKFLTYNHFIAPLGTKPQVLGLFNYYQNHQEQTNVVSISPLRHSELYSKEIGKTWVLQQPK
ncbi:MAG: hypothetical protein ACFFDI_29820 [Promethearchaeota archaeon]